jgi:mRNA interferase RelE/StbE
LAWTIEYDPRAIDDLNRLSREAKADIVRSLEERVAKAANPRDFGKPMRHGRRGLWRHRVRDSRVICQLRDKTLIVGVVGIGPRRDVYVNNVIRVVMSGAIVISSTIVRSL